MHPSKHAPAAAEEATCPVATLPLAQALEHVIPFLPVHERARAACVCRGWCEVLAPASLWLHLDLSCYSSGFPNADALLLGASARACGRLSHLDVSGLLQFTTQTLLSVLTANADHLRELRVSSLDAEERAKNPTLAALLHAAPLLQVLDASASCSVTDARALLRAGPPLRLRSLTMDFGIRPSTADGGPARRYGGSHESVLEFASLMTDLTLQPALTRLGFHYAMTSDPAVLGRIVDVALSRRVSALSLFRCTSPAAMPLARLLADGALKTLSLSSIARRFGPTSSLLDEAGAKLVANALRSTTTLTDVDFGRTNLSRDTGAAVELLGACAGHPTLRSITVAWESPDDPAALGTVLASIVAADSPALHSLDIFHNDLGDNGLAPIVDALSRNRHLQTLNLLCNNMSEDFARLRLLPAVRANTGLRILLACRDDGDKEAMPAAVEAETLVNKRP